MSIINRKAHITFLFLAFILVSQVLFAQQEAQFTQYIYNPTTLNPGYTGSRLSTMLYFQNRQQWIGLEGAPKNLFLNAQTFFEKSKTGLGFEVQSNAIGPITRNIVSFNYSYHLKISDDESIGMGLKFSNLFLNSNFDLLSLRDQNDPFFTNNIENRYNPNFGVGFFYYTDKYYVGLSVPSLFKTNYYNTSSPNELQFEFNNINIYLMAGYVFEIGRSIRVKPASLVRYLNGSFILENSISAQLLNSITIGASYRNGVSLSALAGIQLTNSLFFGYSYDSNIGVFNLNGNSHEIFIRMELLDLKTRIWNARFF